MVPVTFVNGTSEQQKAEDWQSDEEGCAVKVVHCKVERGCVAEVEDVKVDVLDICSFDSNSAATLNILIL